MFQFFKNVYDKLAEILLQLSQIEKLSLQQIRMLHKLTKHKPFITITFFFNKQTIGGILMNLTTRVSDGVKKGHINPTNDAGTSEPVQAQSVVYNSSNEAVFTVASDPDDQSKFVLTPVGVGEADLNVSADADLGDGVTTISASAHIVVLEEEATKIDIIFDDEQAPAA